MSFEITDLVKSIKRHWLFITVMVIVAVLIAAVVARLASLSNIKSSRQVGVIMISAGLANTQVSFACTLTRLKVKSTLLELWIAL